MHHRQIVDAPRRYELVIQPRCAGRSGVVEREIIVYDHFRINIEFFGHKMSDEPFLVARTIHAAYHRKHVFLLRKGIAVVDRPVEMNGKVRNGQ